MTQNILRNRLRHKAAIFYIAAGLMIVTAMLYWVWNLPAILEGSVTP